MFMGQASHVQFQMQRSHLIVHTPDYTVVSNTMKLGVSSQIFTLEGGALQIVENDALV